jgi:hypothetical protein
MQEVLAAVEPRLGEEGVVVEGGVLPEPLRAGHEGEDEGRRQVDPDSQDRPASQRVRAHDEARELGQLLHGQRHGCGGTYHCRRAAFVPV